MAETAPIYFPADKLPLTTSADVTAGQVVVVSGANTVAPIASASEAWLGVAAHDAASGKAIVVYTEGVHQVPSSGSIAAGKPVIGASGGAVAAFANGNTGGSGEPETVIGVALSAAANSKVVIKLR